MDADARPSLLQLLSCGCCSLSISASAVPSASLSASVLSCCASSAKAWTSNTKLGCRKRHPGFGLMCSDPGSRQVVPAELLLWNLAWATSVSNKKACSHCSLWAQVLQCPTNGPNGPRNSVSEACSSLSCSVDGNGKNTHRTITSLSSALMQRLSRICPEPAELEQDCCPRLGNQSKGLPPSGSVPSDRASAGSCRSWSTKLTRRLSRRPCLVHSRVCSTWPPICSYAAIGSHPHPTLPWQSLVWLICFYNGLEVVGFE